MKMLIERTPIAAAPPFVLDDLKLHVRIEGEEEDSALTKMGNTAVAEFEQLAQVALLTQSIRLTIFDPEPDQYLFLPIGPAVADTEPTVTIDGEAFTNFEFVGGTRSLIRWGGQYLSLSATRITVTYLAGFGANPADIPDDISQVILDQAGLYYDGRSPLDPKSLTSSPHMARIAARYRGVQL